MINKLMKWIFSNPWTYVYEQVSNQYRGVCYFELVPMFRFKGTKVQTKIRTLNGNSWTTLDKHRANIVLELMTLDETGKYTIGRIHSDSQQPVTNKDIHMERKLASVQRIAEIQPIPNSDNLAHYRINNWWVVDRINAHQLGDLVIYFEIDSWIPHTLAPFLSRGKEPRVYLDIPGERLRTVKLRGALSQGLILPVPQGDYPEDHDLTEFFQINKWEPPVSAQLAGLVRGNFPTFFPKTDQERIQNIPSRRLDQLFQLNYQVTEKLHGSSMSVYFRNDDWGVTSRNVDLKTDDNNAFSVTFRNYLPVLEELAIHLSTQGISDFVVQGELCGPGINGNQYALPTYKFFVFNIYNIGTQRYLSPPSVHSLCSYIKLDHVPVLTDSCSLTTDIPLLLDSANGTSVLNSSAREGLVFKSTTTQDSFKVISNNWLLKNE